MKRAIPLLVIALSFFGQGCFTTASLKPADTNDPGMVSLTAGAMSGEGGAAIVEIRLGLLERTDIGIRHDWTSTSLDLRVQILDTETGGPVDCSLEGGAGFAGWTTFKYAGIFFSKDLGGFTPIIGYRYVDGPDPGSDDVDDAIDEDDTFAEELIELLLDETYPVHEVFLGAELAIDEDVTLVVELLWLPDLDNYTQVNAGIRIEFR